MKASERSLVTSISIGGFIEWYPIFLYIYWASILSKKFLSDISLPTTDLLIFIVVLLGVVSRPIGGLIFGSRGDRNGRKKSFIQMIVITSFLNFFTAIMPTFSSWSLSFLLLIGIMRFLQGIPSGGELPGALCLLAENSNRENRRYLCSYLLIGPQIAQVVSMTQCYFMQKYCSHEFLISYGWRISFLIAALFGFLGSYVKKELVESHLFLRLQDNNEILKNPLRFSLKHYKTKIILAFLLTMFEVVGFFLITFYAVENSNKVFHLRIQDHLFLSVFVFTPIVFIMPLIGKIGDRINNKQLYIFSAIGSILFSILFCFSATFSYKIFAAVFFIFLVLTLCFPFALLPSLIADLFPTKVRYIPFANQNFDSQNFLLTV